MALADRDRLERSGLRASSRRQLERARDARHGFARRRAAGGGRRAWRRARRLGPGAGWIPRPGLRVLPASRRKLAGDARRVRRPLAPVGRRQTRAVNANGDAVLAWTTTDFSAATSVPYATWRAAGGAWLAPERLSGAATKPLTESPAVAIDPVGDATVAWEFKDAAVSGAHSVIQASRHVPDGFFPWSFVPATLSDTAEDAYAPAVAGDGNGNATVLWGTNDVTAEQIAGVDFSAASGTWSTTPYPVSGADANVGSPAIAFDQRGDATAVWRFGTAAGHQSIQSSDRPAGGSWSQNATNVSGDLPTADVFGPVVSIAPSGQQATAWADDASGSMRVSASVRVSGGGWQTPHTADPTPAHPSADPSIAIDNAGSAVLIYDGSTIRAASYSAPSLNSTSIPARGTVGVPVSFNTSPIDA
jgi:hypothetical protein